jgi:hypothetical protein
VRLLLTSALVFTACAPSREPEAPPKPDPTKEAWYAPAVDKLIADSREAERLFKRGRRDDASAIITKAQPMIKRVLAVPQPTLPAMEAVSDLDDLYGRMLLSKRHYGWARLFFQKNVARWKNWQPPTEETARRRKLAEAAIAECDRRLLP